MKTRCPNCACNFEIVDLSSDAIECPTCGSRINLCGSTEDTISIETNQRFTLAHFTLSERLGSGQFGTVWKAYDTKLKRHVAVKILHSVRQEREQLAAFFREAETAARLLHPNIVRVYEVGRDDRPYIVSELIEGVSLRERLSSFLDRPKEAAQLCGKLARALNHAHDRGVVHRDMKPANVLLDMDGEPHITDFGLAKQDSTEMTIATDGQILGTPAYMSPEQAAGKSHDAGPQSDIYSLGVILYELLTNTRPFLGGKMQLIYQIQRDDPPDPRTIHPTVPADLCSICLKCLEKRSDQRYASGNALADDLERFVRGEAVTARPWPLSRKLLRFARRHAQPLAFGCLAVLVAVLALNLVQSRRPDWWETAPTVAINTIPTGADILFVPLQIDTLRPQPDEAIHVGKSPTRNRVPPGTYLVVASQGPQLFHEVIRTVPSPDAVVPQNLPHRYWRRDEQGVIRLDTVRLFRQSDVDSTMVQVPARTMTTHIEGRSQRFQVPAFFIDRSETLTGAVRASDGEGQLALEGPDGEPCLIPFDQAVAALEFLGKRLPDELELQRVADDGDLARSVTGVKDSLSEWTFSASRFVRARVVVYSTEREFIIPQDQQRTIGFRGVRSLAPRTRPVDFLRPVEVSGGRG